jgi:exodeoxyribonuclease V alpha subunit
MIEPFSHDEPGDRRLALGVTGLLGRLNAEGTLEASDVHTASRICELAGESDDDVSLALALAVRSLRHGSVCLDLADPEATTGPGIPERPGASWADRVGTSRLAEAGVLRVEGSVVYLDRYWREETQVCDALLARLGNRPPPVDEARLTALASRLFGAGFDDQRAAATQAARQWTTVVTGGPGTGKTTAVAGLLTLLADQSETPLRVALTAPTGKAAARLQEAVRSALAEPALAAGGSGLGEPTAQTLHRLLGWRRGSRNRFRHDRSNRLPHDVIVVDETSMVSLTMMARLLEAVRSDCRLILVGDPGQLASVEAGAVLADLVDGLRRRAPETVVELKVFHRFGDEIKALASALRAGDGDGVLSALGAGAGPIEFLDPDDPVTLPLLRERQLQHALDLRAAAEGGSARTAVAALDGHRLLCAHRDGPWGVHHWNRLVERGLSDRLGAPIGGGWGREWYAGRPLLLTTNDYGLDLFNGDTGVVVAEGDDLRAAIAGPGEPRIVATSRLTDVETMHAMTVHKSQGSQARDVTVLLPPEDSRLLSRELFYTAVTRAQESVVVVGTESSVRLAVGRHVQRASGLAARLAQHPVGET